MFKRLNIKGWRQFSNVDISFHDHLTVITGANGAGKTTILNLLSEYIGWQSQFVSSLELDDNGLVKYDNSHEIDDTRMYIREEIGVKKLDNNLEKLGELEFSDARIVNLMLPANVNAGTYKLLVNDSDKVKGVYINSHRPTFPYKTVKSIPTSVATREQIFGKYNTFLRTYVFDTYRNTEELSATSLIKETLASLAIFGYGNASVTPNDSARKLFEGYIDILKRVLPSKLGFKNIKVNIPEVTMCTETGEFPLDAISGGLSSIIAITWQLYMYADVKEKFVALIDEPENHLHPQLQKTLLGNLISAFPNVQFVVATHNPFMITAQKDSNVYVLDYNEKHKVYSTLLDHVNRAGTSNAILRDVLGIDSSIPQWAEATLESIIIKYMQKELTNDLLNDMRKELSQIGLSEYIPETIIRTVIKSNKN